MHAEFFQHRLRVGQHVHQVRNWRTLVTTHVADAAFEQRLGDGENTLAAKLVAGAEALGEHADAVTEGFTIACIGPITARAAKERGWPVHVVPDDYTADGLVDALRAYYASSE